MKYFCERGRRAADAEARRSRPGVRLPADVVKICAEQATTITDTVVKE